MPFFFYTWTDLPTWIYIHTTIHEPKATPPLPTATVAAMIRFYEFRLPEGPTPVAPLRMDHGPTKISRNADARALFA